MGLFITEHAAVNLRETVFLFSLFQANRSIGNIADQKLKACPCWNGMNNKKEFRQIN